MAIATLINMEKRCIKQTQLKEQYVQFKRSVTRTHGSGEQGGRRFNFKLPSILLFYKKNSSTSKKLRAVFDAARKTTNNRSLNNNEM